MIIPEGITLKDRIALYLAEYERGCTVTQVTEAGQVGPENCPECVKAFVNAVKEAVAFDPHGHRGHQTIEVTKMDDQELHFLCLDCNVEYTTAASIPPASPSCA